MTRLAATWIIPVTLYLGLAATAEAKPKFRVEALEESAPVDIVSEAVRGKLSGKGHRIFDRKGRAYIDLWLASCAETVQARSNLGVNFPQFAEGTLLGVVRYHRKIEDFRGQGCAPGLYTCRYVIQPEDGDHQGVSDSRDFLLLIDAKADRKPDPRSIKELFKLSEKVVGSGHPAILYLMQRLEEEQELPRLVEDKDADLWLLECAVPVRPAAQESAKARKDRKDSEVAPRKPLRLWIVIDGVAVE